MWTSKRMQKRIQFIVGCLLSVWLVTNAAWLATTSSIDAVTWLTVSTIVALKVFLYHTD
ncbi:hypothetical protein [Thalassotalea maritima]|uniref:hypothetical protein n=1 Tax=Thalassotalea maritima TaxID=3242416 RepID=UPI0035297552